MAKKWRQFRTTVTAIMVLFGIGLLVAAWFSVGRFRGEVVVDLVLLGLVLPIGFYGVLTLVGWQRSAATEAAPGPLAAWCVKHKVGMVAPLALIFCLLGLMQNLGSALDRPSRSDDTSDEILAFRNNCEASANRSFAAKGGDPDAAQTKTLIGTFCGCMATEMQADYTEGELVALAADQSSLAKDGKYNRIMQKCQRASRG